MVRLLKYPAVLSIDDSVSLLPASVKESRDDDDDDVDDEVERESLGNPMGGSSVNDRCDGTVAAAASE